MSSRGEGSGCIGENDIKSDSGKSGSTTDPGMGLGTGNPVGRGRVATGEQGQGT